MFFKRKNKLRDKYDRLLIIQMEKAKKNWFQQRELQRLSVEQTDEMICLTKIAEAKYFFLFREAKKRRIRIKN
ncbi:hypothetical protein J2S13_002993 [Oikeobacillus pervagus]|uniref:DUF2508 family protein n=1 Tax=Oikeobacillus pervagus TaxID=1325931 RepID=A0AAJ1T0X7_9BACI|nr:YaaL family protein [Oikeobacillus pervagus]MDQ0216533.1 hypothetical protein [Oikeobacillus pervagus]